MPEAVIGGAASIQAAADEQASRWASVTGIIDRVAAAPTPEAALAILAGAMLQVERARAVEIRDQEERLAASAVAAKKNTSAVVSQLDCSLSRGEHNVGYVRFLDLRAAETELDPVTRMLLGLTTLAMAQVPASTGEASPLPALATPSIESPVLSFLCRMLCQKANADFATAVVAMPATDELLPGSFGLRSRAWTEGLAFSKEGLIRKVVEVREPMLVHAADRDSSAAPAEAAWRLAEGARTLLALPVVTDGPARSSILVGWRRTITLSADEVEHVHGHARMLAPLTAGAGTRDRLSVLSRMVDLIHQDRELDTLLGELLEYATVALNSKHGAVLLLDNRDHRLEPIASRGLPPAFFRGVASMKKGLRGDSSTRAILSGRTTITDDLMMEPDWKPLHGLAAPLGLRAVWAAPVSTIGGSVIGALTIYQQAPGGPTPEQRALLDMAADVAGQVYNQSRLRRQDADLPQPEALMGAQLAGVAEYIRDGVVVVDSRGRVIYRNKVARAMGADPSIPPRQVPLASRAYYIRDGQQGFQRLQPWQLPSARALRGETVASAELLVEARSGDGPHLTLDVSAAPLRDDDGHIVGAILLLGDTRLTRDIQASDATLRAVEEATPYGIAVFDAAGEKLWANRAAAGMAGAGLEVALDREDDAPLHISDEQGIPLHTSDLPVRQVLRTGQPVRGKVVQAAMDGTVRWVQWNAVPITQEGRQSGSVVMSAMDVTEHKRTELALMQQATHDALTGLPNRASFERHVQAASGSLAHGQPLALLLLDIDRFREVNDTLGHGNGDVLVQQFASRLAARVGSAGLVARLGGDEFGVLLVRAQVVAATAMARTILTMLDAPFEIAGQSIDVDVSIGIALCPDHSADASSLLRQADIAMYAAKHAHEGFAIYSSKLDSFSPDRIRLLGELRRSIEQDDLFLAYQPLIRVADRCVTGVEALVRWRHPVLGLIEPDRFISLAEGTGAIHPLTSWVLNEALRQCGSWRRTGHDLQVSVNLSARNLQDQTLPSRVLDLLLKHQVPPDRLTLEITESAIMADPTGAMVVLTRLSNIGVHLAIDDFGTGYSSLAYLQRLPTQHIKIDKSFTLGLLENASDVAIVRAIIDLGHNLGRTIVAEGVEHEAVLDLLAEMNCDYAQGYYLSRPLAQPAIDEWIDRNA